MKKKLAAQFLQRYTIHNMFRICITAIAVMVEYWSEHRTRLLEWTLPRGGSGRSKPADDRMLAVLSVQRTVMLYCQYNAVLNAVLSVQRRCGGSGRRNVHILVGGSRDPNKANRTKVRQIDKFGMIVYYKIVINNLI